MPETASPPAAPAEPAPAAPLDQTDANLEIYERTFRKCLNIARGMLRDDVDHRSEVPPLALKVEIAVVLFQQFYADQGAISNFQRQTQAVVDGVQRVMEGRR